MKKMFLVFTHKLTLEQKKDANKTLGVEDFVYLPSDLQYLWSNVSPYSVDFSRSLQPIYTFLKENATDQDFILIQGEFGATVLMVNLCSKQNLKTLYATTERESSEIKRGNKIIKKSVFKHIQFRKYKIY